MRRLRLSDPDPDPDLTPMPTSRGAMAITSGRNAALTSAAPDLAIAAAQFQFVAATEALAP